MDVVNGDPHFISLVGSGLPSSEWACVRATPVSLFSFLSVRSGGVCRTSPHPSPPLSLCAPGGVRACLPATATMPLQVTVYASDAKLAGHKGPAPGRILNIPETWSMDELRRQLYQIAYSFMPGPSTEVRLFAENGVELEDLQYLPMAPGGRIYVSGVRHGPSP
jgi:hypothetical protein